MLRIQRNHIDIWLLIAVLALMVISVGLVYSASAEWSLLGRKGSESHILDLHAIKILFSIAALFVGINVPYSVYKKFGKPLLLISIALLILTKFLGGETKGAARWLRFGGLGFQPSELAKFALLFYLSQLLESKGERIRDLKTGLVPLLVWIGSVAALVLLQPNFSTGMMIALLSVMMIFVGGARMSHLLTIALIGLTVVALYFTLVRMNKGYQMKRVHDYVEYIMGGEPVGQLKQGLIAFGNGGVFGVGPGESRQRDLYLTESYDDFIYSILGEEYGIVGTVLVLASFVFILYRGFRIAKHAKDVYGRYLAVAVTGTITLYTLVNACVSLGMLPITGLPMPFISYGGTSLVLSAFAVGVLLNISSYSDLFPRISKNAGPVETSLEPETGLGKVY